MRDEQRAMVECRDPTTMKLIEQHLAEANRLRREGGVNGSQVAELERKAMEISGGAFDCWQLRDGLWYRSLGPRGWWLVGRSRAEEVKKELEAERQAFEDAGRERFPGGSPSQSQAAVTAALKAMQTIVEDEQKRPELRINAAKVIAALQRHRGRPRGAGRFKA